MQTQPQQKQKKYLAGSACPPLEEEIHSRDVAIKV